MPSGKVKYSILGIIFTVIAFTVFPILFAVLVKHWLGSYIGILVALMTCRPTKGSDKWLWMKLGVK